MLHVDGPVYVNSYGTLVFETIHFDKAGETSSIKVVSANVAEFDASGRAILATEPGIHVLFPSAHLHAVEPGRSKTTWVGGQSLTRDFHNAIQPATLRWMTREEVLGHIEAAKPRRRR